MRIRPGRTALILAGAGCVLGLGCLVWPGLWLALTGLGLAALAGGTFDWRWLRRAFRQVEVVRGLPACAGRGVPFEAALTLRNAGPAALALEVRDATPAQAAPELWLRRATLPPGESVRLAVELRIHQRGRYDFGPVWVRIQGRLGLLEAQRPVDAPGRIRVYPESVLPGQAFAALAGEISWAALAARSRLRGDGLEFESITPYVPGDDPRHIDWRSTAKTRAPMVRRFQLEQRRDILVVIDCGRLMAAQTGAGTKLDRAVDSALMLARTALARGDRCGAAVYDNRMQGFLPPQTGQRAFHTLLESLFDLRCQYAESDFTSAFAALQARQRKRALVIVLSDVAEAETSERLRSGLAALAKRHVAVFAALQTPALRRYVRAPVESPQDAARKAVTLRLLQDRERALHFIRRAGAHVLDVEPERLTVPLINQYVSLRERGVV